MPAAPQKFSKPITTEVPDPIVHRRELGREFAKVLGIDPASPASTWKPVGDLETLTGSLQSICVWMDKVNLHQHVGELPPIPHVNDPETGDLVPARGTRDVFDVCVRAWHGRISPAQIQSEWTTQLRKLLNATEGAPGFRAQAQRR